MSLIFRVIRNQAIIFRNNALKQVLLKGACWFG